MHMNVLECVRLVRAIPRICCDPALPESGVIGAGTRLESQTRTLPHPGWHSCCHWVSPLAAGRGGSDGAHASAARGAAPPAVVEGRRRRRRGCGRMMRCLHIEALQRRP
eukprot:GHVU01134530.1.p1 GENE.GHVU01134530.1~~GHVU01134530.1.p1  ORF type:complete len:109 (-),score=4.14 GHVU01134530.1:167-493(-)